MVVIDIKNFQASCIDFIIHYSYPLFTTGDLSNVFETSANQFASTHWEIMDTQLTNATLLITLLILSVQK